MTGTLFRTRKKLQILGDPLYTVVRIAKSSGEVDPYYQGVQMTIPERSDRTQLLRDLISQGRRLAAISNTHSVSLYGGSHEWLRL